VPPRRPPTPLGAPVAADPKHWVQTERAAHEKWARLTIRTPIAAAILHKLVAVMGHQNAAVIPQKTLARMVGCHPRSVANAINTLVAEKWIQVVQIGPRGTVNAYVVNDRVAWGEARDLMPRLSAFSAVVIAEEADQDQTTMDQAPLNRIPFLYADEGQLPAGDGEPPPSQPALPGMDPDLPALKK